MTTGRLPNIILIVVDTLRGDHVSCYGHERRTTPHLDALAADATLYTTALSPGAWTPPSHASIFTGTYPSRHGVDRTHPYLDGDLTTLPWKTLEAPFFAFLHYMEPHEPYRPPARFLRHHLGGQSARRVTGVNQHALKFMSGVVPMGAEEFDRLGRLYDAEVSYADHCIGELIEG